MVSRITSYNVCYTKLLRLIIEGRKFMLTNNKNVLTWVDEMIALTKPANIVWIDGSEEQLKALTKEAISTGELEGLNEEKLPGCLLHRTAVNDVARVEHRTFICSRDRNNFV